MRLIPSVAVLSPDKGMKHLSPTPLTLDVLTTAHDLALFVAITGLQPTLLAADAGQLRAVWQLRDDGDVRTGRLLVSLLDAVNGELPIRPLLSPEVLVLIACPLNRYGQARFAQAMRAVEAPAD